MKEMITLSVCSLVILMIFSQGGDSIRCISCYWSIYNPSYNPNCFNYTDPDDSYTPTVDCDSSTGDFCETELDIDDGIITKIYRRCPSGSAFEQNSTLTEKCVSDYYPDGTNVDSATCYLRCDDKDVCNDQTPENLHVCSDYCGSYAECDYTIGQCVCREGYTEPNCERPSQATAKMNCVQCDSDSDPSCFTRTTPTECLSTSQKYCAVSSVSTFDKDGQKVRSFLTRSCTEDYVAANECFISGGEYILDSQIEYTCVSTCDTDGCNTGTPDGAGTESTAVQPIRCVVCNSNDGLTSCAGSTYTDICPSNSTHCLSTVSYYISEKTDLSNKEAHPEYQLKSVERACATKEVERKCTETNVGGSTLKVVTCQETCKEDGCNTGWPARPKCSQCECDNQCSSYDKPCFFDPPSPTSCDFPYQNYCVIEDINRDVGGVEKDAVNGYPRTITRKCSHYNVGNMCQASKYSNKTEDCYKTCQEDGCNLGFSPYSSPLRNEKSTLQQLFNQGFSPYSSLFRNGVSTLQPWFFLIQVTLLLFAVFLF